MDLAGSERLKGSEDFDRPTVKETKAINKSLFTLGQVRCSLIFAFLHVIRQVLWAVRSTSRGKPRGAPYRESKLTRLLWDGLQGKGRTLMIACCTPFQSHREETMQTLRLASTAIRIKSVPTVVLDAKDQLIQKLRDDILRMKRENRCLSLRIERLEQSKKSTFQLDRSTEQEYRRIHDNSRKSNREDCNEGITISGTDSLDDVKNQLASQGISDSACTVSELSDSQSLQEDLNNGLAVADTFPSCTQSKRAPANSICLGR